MKSLRGQLLWATALGMAAVLLALATLLHAQIGRTLRAEFDATLAARARALTALVEQDDEGVEFDLAEIALPEFEPSSDAEYCQLASADRTVLFRSPSLLDGDLPRADGSPGSPGFKTLTLPDGRPGRVVVIEFLPRLERPLRAGVRAPLTLALARDTRGLTATLTQVRAILVFGSVAALALSTGVLAFAIRRGLQPVSGLARQIAKTRPRNLSSRIDAAGLPRELVPIADRLNELLARLEAAFQRERQFTGDVAHELRTPLAGLRATLELALARSRAPDEYRSALATSLAINAHMQRTIENLLHLARADAGQLAVECAQVELDEVIHESCRLLGAKGAVTSGEIACNLQPNLGMQTDRHLLQLIVRNLLDNAVTHGDRPGPVSVQTATDNGQAVITIRNQAGNLTRDDLPHIFERFWRGDRAHRHDDNNHVGLGLPLCRAVTERLGGSIDAALGSDGTFTVTLRLPLGANDDSHA